MGCSRRCVFCAQYAQSGTSPRALTQALSTAATELQARQAAGLPPVELAFFGGTFTALPRDALCSCLDMAADQRARGTVSCLRCSTRPDAVSAPLLQELHAAGFTTIELGIQSFDEKALTRSCRGYDSATARQACRTVREADLQLGVQLLPGMPGVNEPLFLNDVRAALESGARWLRFYPCMVFTGTELAHQWREGHFQPWTLQQTLPTLAQGLLLAEAAGATVIRMGLAPQAGLESHILAGPQHKALGSAVRGWALLLQAREALARNGTARATGLHAPRYCQGHLWGDKGVLRPLWGQLGIRPDNVRWVDAEQVEILTP